MNNQLKFAVVAAAFTLAACGGGGVTNGTGTIPGTTQTSLGSLKLELAVGTAFNANGSTTGLNVVSSFRQANGSSGVLADNPSISGPFTVPATMPGAYAASGNVDDGTNTISSSPQVAQNVTPVNSTLGTFTGAFSYGLAPLNSDQITQQAYYPGNPNGTPGNGFIGSQMDSNGSLPFWALPIGAPAASKAVFLVGPPAVPFFRDGTFPVNFAGYSPGFTAFAVTPGAGTNYTMKVNVVAANAPSQSFSATASLSNLTVLPAPAVSVSSKNGGGFAGTVTVGADPRIVETQVFVVDTTAATFYTIEVKGTGAQSFTLPPMLGPCSGSGCQNAAATQTPSIATGDSYYIAAVSFDYPALEAGPPANTSQTPTLTGGAGQTDLAIGTYVTGTY